MLASVTESLACLRTDSGVDLLNIDPYSIYLMERQLVEAAEVDEAGQASSRWLEATFLAALRTDLQRECDYHSILEGGMIGAKRARIQAPDHAAPGVAPGNPWAQKRFRAVSNSSASSPLEDLHADLRDTIPELSAWARAAAEQEAQRDRAKRRRHMMEIV